MSDPTTKTPGQVAQEAALRYWSLPHHEQTYGDYVAAAVIAHHEAERAVTLPIPDGTYTIPSTPPPGETPTPLIAEVLAEVERATRKFPTWPSDPLHALAVLGEEFGELTKEVVQLTYEPHKSSRDAVHKEAIQTAAMALRFVLSLGLYRYTPGEQHSQKETK